MTSSTASPPYRPRAVASLFDDDGTTDPVVAEAITWMVNLSSGEATDRERAEFTQWYAADSTHGRAWDRLSGSLGRLHVAAELPSRQTGELARRIARGEVGKKEPTRLDRRRVIKAAVLGVAATTSGILIDRVIPLGDLLADHSTWTGERKNVTLAHGGGIVLGPRSAVKIDVNAEREEVRLLSGELFLETTAPRRLPLTLTASDWTIRPSQGRVTLHHRDPVLSAAALDDGMEIEFSNLPSIRLNAQKSLSLADGRLIEAEADVAREAAWSKGLLVIKDGHLADVVRSLKPYFVGIIRVSPAAAAIRTGGVFRLSEPHATFSALAEALPIVVREVTPFWIDIRVAA